MLLNLQTRCGCSEGYVAKANKIIEDTGIFTFKKFEDAYYGRLKDAMDIFPFFDEYITNLSNDGMIKTAIGYKSSKNSFKLFRKSFGLYDVTPQFLKDYELFEKKRGLSNTSISMYVRTLRSIYNYAISVGVIKKDELYPFGKRKYVIPASRNVKKALSINDVSKIHNYKTVPGTSKDKARDFWIFSYLCNGINFKDIAMLKNKNIDNNMLRFIRAKTKNTTRENQITISCFLGEQAKLIIKKWRNNDRSSEAYLFPILGIDDSPEEQVKRIGQFIKNTNKYMKLISESIGLEKPATTYFGRHTAATILKRSGASIIQIQEALGHQSSTTTQRYLDSFDDDSKKILSDSLTKFL